MNKNADVTQLALKKKPDKASSFFFNHTIAPLKPCVISLREINQYTL